MSLSVELILNPTIPKTLNALICNCAMEYATQFKASYAQYFVMRRCIVGLGFDFPDTRDPRELTLFMLGLAHRVYDAQKKYNIYMCVRILKCEYAQVEPAPEIKPKPKPAPKPAPKHANCNYANKFIPTLNSAPKPTPEPSPKSKIRSKYILARKLVLVHEKERIVKNLYSLKTTVTLEAKKNKAGELMLTYF